MDSDLKLIVGMYCFIGALVFTPLIILSLGSVTGC